MTTLGMDTAAGRAASQQLDNGSKEIAALASRLDTVLHAFDWLGSDADTTRESWAGTARPSLDTTAQHLAQLAVQIRHEAEAQDAASGDGSTGADATSTSVSTDAASGGLMGFLGKVGTFVSSRIVAAFQGLGHTLGQAGGLASKIEDELTGTKDWSVAAIAASALGTVGAGAGTVANAITGQDQNWFGEGPGLAGTAVAAPTDPSAAGPFQPVVTRPTDLPSLMQGVTDGYQVGSAPGSNGDIRITRIDNGDGHPAYVVAIPGTESWAPGAGATERDLSANINLVAGNPTAAAESVQKAMDAAGIPAGSRGMLVGHSQGGIIAGALASDPAFVQRYGVTNVMTYAAPIDQLNLAPGVSTLQIAHGNDLVPRLDLGGLETDGSFNDNGAARVTLDSPGSFWQLGTNHSYSEYRDSVRTALGADTDAGRTLRDYQSTLTPFFVQPGGTATAVDVPVSRGK